MKTVLNTLLGFGVIIGAGMIFSWYRDWITITITFIIVLLYIGIMYLHVYTHWSREKSKSEGSLYSL